MKQCDRSLSPFAAIGSSSLSSFVASESDPEDSLWNDFTFDFSFLTSEDHKICPNHDVPKAEESELYSLTASALRKKEDFSQPVRENSNFVESDLKCVESQSSLSLAVVSTSDFDSDVTMGEGLSQCFPSPAAPVLEVTGLSPVVASDDSGYNGVEGRSKDESACSGNVWVRKDISESNCSPLFSEMSALRINGFGIDKLTLCSTNEKSSLRIDQEETEVDSPCWRGTRSHKSVASGTKSLSFMRFSDDQNCLYGLNPLAPQFIPSNTKKNLDKNGIEVEEKSSSSLKRSLSSTFSPLSGEFSITDPSEARIGGLIHDVDESLGLVSQDCLSNTMSMLDISNEFQKPRKLNPLAPDFVPACAKLSDVVHEKHGAEDHRIAIETNAHSTTAVSSSDNMFLSNVKVETNSSEVDHSLRNRYSHNVHEWGTTYSFNPQLRSQVQISENTKLDRSSNKSHGRKKLNPLAPQFSLADNKQKVYGCEENRAGNDLPSMVNSSVLVSPIGYKNHKELHAGLARSSVHVEASFNGFCTKEMKHRAPDILHGNSSLMTQPTKVGDNFEHLLPFHMSETAVSSSSSDVKALSDFGDRHGCSRLPSPKMDVKKLLTTIHGLSELLAHAHSSETLDSPNEQYLDLINCTVQNLNSFISNRVPEHTKNYASDVHSPCDLYSLPNMCKRSIRDEKYSMVSGDMVPDSHFEFGVNKENGFGKVIGNHRQTEEEQISPHVFFYNSLWLKAKADRSLMEYATLLEKLLRVIRLARRNSSGRISVHNLRI